MPSLSSGATTATATATASAPAATASAPAAATPRATASGFYNTGSEALAQGNLGEAVLFLRAASRLEPRATDVARNLAIAEARVALARGEGAPGVAASPSFLLSGGEAWLLAALLVGIGASGRFMEWRRLRNIVTESAAAAAHASRPRRQGSRLTRYAGYAGLGLMALLVAGSIVAQLAPEAVVLDESLPLTAASGQPLPDSPSLVAGERVRLGPEREGLIEIRLGGTTVGWAHRAGVWRVSDAARYTLASSRERMNRGGGSNG